MSAVCHHEFGMTSYQTTHELILKGPNILLKLHIDCAYILRDIAIFIFGPFGLKLPIHAHFWGSFGGCDGVPLGIGYRRQG